jgi:hypothetical protein
VKALRSASQALSSSRQPVEEKNQHEKINLIL